ncbi:MAG: elongation factor P maturation arginine rhamnosyltransferase EarP [Burkholderiales bacterium]|nr:elongation factor P maturation arginine rhamnosyltransferase EarP [Burkholderiales bacterium]
MPQKRWDVFCRVIDNYGDIGVTWRLARQLVAEHARETRLWVDDLESLERLCPDVDPRLAAQRVQGVDVRRWDAAAASAQPADVVVEGFGCELPAAYCASMAAAAGAGRAPAWINLEYLSAEEWVAGCHGLPSPHPQLGLMRHFFFPGFSAGTGGLLRERGLLEARDAYQGNPAAQAAFWQRIGIPPKARNEWRVSLFSYAKAPVQDLLAGLSAHPHPVRLIVPMGPSTMQVAEWLGMPAEPGAHGALGNLSASIVPFVEQPDYDRLLWGCDLNFVRGEDSFVRAQWAGRPLVWQIYPQSEGAHAAKLGEFLRRYCQGLHEPRRQSVERFMALWNGIAAGATADPLGLGTTGDWSFEEVWRGFAANQSALRLHAEEWAWRLAEGRDLAAQLVEFSGKVAEKPVK